MAARVAARTGRVLCALPGTYDCQLKSTQRFCKRRTIILSQNGVKNPLMGNFLKNGSSRHDETFACCGPHRAASGAMGAVCEIFFSLELRPPEETDFRVTYDVASSDTLGIEWSRENTGGSETVCMRTPASSKTSGQRTRRDAVVSGWGLQLVGSSCMAAMAGEEGDGRRSGTTKVVGHLTLNRENVVNAGGRE